MVCVQHVSVHTHLYSCIMGYPERDDLGLVARFALRFCLLLLWRVAAHTTIGERVFVRHQQRLNGRRQVLGPLFFVLQTRVGGVSV
jgi:hypothetical protein